MSVSAWILMLAAWGVIIAITVYLFVRVLRTPANKD